MATGRARDRRRPWRRRPRSGGTRRRAPYRSARARSGTWGIPWASTATSSARVRLAKSGLPDCCVCRASRKVHPSERQMSCQCGGASVHRASPSTAPATICSLHHGGLVRVPAGSPSGIERPEIWMRVLGVWRRAHAEGKRRCFKKAGRWSTRTPRSPSVPVL